MVIGALGVLDDVTVSQASTVMALRRANPHSRARELYRGALDVGRDHVAATVNTLVLAYVGASLPILLIFTVGHTSFADAINVEAVATTVVATLVGSIGLIAAVPITTALAALLACQLRPEDVRRRRPRPRALAPRTTGIEGGPERGPSGQATNSIGHSPPNSSIIDRSGGTRLPRCPVVEFSRRCRPAARSRPRARSRAGRS